VRFPFAAALAALVLAAGCGGDDEGSAPPAEPVPAAGELTPAGGTPGVPRGAEYDLRSTAYLELSAKGTVRVASDYIDDNPEDCKGADPGRVAAYTYTAIGTDFPLTAPVAEVLKEGCAADLQS
jgi:hypothetical protein